MSHRIPRRGLAALPFASALPAAGAVPPSAPLRRTVLALYDSRVDPNLRIAQIHRLTAMPIEWLGLVPRYHDVRAGLPSFDEADILGAITCFPEPTLPDLAAFASWVERLVASGRRLVAVGDIGSEPGRLPSETRDMLRRRIFATLGLTLRGNWQAVTRGDRILHEAAPFEAPAAEGAVNAHEVIEAGPGVTAWTVVQRRDGQRSVVASSSAHGGHIAPGFVTAMHVATGTQRWRIDPFAFFDAAFGVAGQPRPDTTTLCGRRIYYSHIDGDAWQSVSQVRGPGGQRVTNAEVILQRVIAPNPDLPVTVAPIGAEIDTAARGDARAINTARALFAMPQVEIATHTQTHPFDWRFFESYTRAKEDPFRETWRRMQLDPGGWGSLNATPELRERNGGSPTYTVPRAYGDRTFDLTDEVSGSRARMEALAPRGKRCPLLQWSGDCAPFPAAIAAVEEAGMVAINGGDTRCDNDHPSVSAVAPTGLQMPGAGLQIYASNSNENTYTELWSNRFFGFRDLPLTWERTGAPRRLKPMNLYYHMYSGERLASLQALQDNITALRRSPFIGVTTSRFVHAARGFYRARLLREGEAAWRVLDRDGLATLRFADAGARMLDAEACRGVLGESIANGDLYVALDPAEPAPLIVLRARSAAPPPRPLLRDASWEVSALQWQASGDFGFQARGWGPGAFAFSVRRDGAWRVSAGTWQGRVESRQNLLAFSLPPHGADGLAVTLTPA